MKWHASPVCERRADEAERESDKLKEKQSMSYHLGEEYGNYLQCYRMGPLCGTSNTMEGLIHINTLRDDYYVFDQDAYELRGDMTGKIFPRLGQKVRVRVANADKMLKTVDFVLAEED